MHTLQVPLIDIERPNDPAFEERVDLVKARTLKQPIISSHARVIGHLANTKAFASKVDFPSLYPQHRRDAPDFYNGRIPFRIDQANGNALYRMPEPLTQFKEAIKLIAQYEHGSYRGSRYIDNVMQISVRQFVVRAGAKQMGTAQEVHRDGDADHWQHIYLISDAFPTEFFGNETVKFGGDDRDLDPAKVGQPFVPLPYDITFANSTSLHRSPIVPSTLTRTFMRVIYTHAI